MKMVVSLTSGVPLYVQIVDQIRQQIVSGELAEGEPLPSLRALASDLRVSLITTTRAYNELAAEGLTVNVPGKGSFVAQIDSDAARQATLDRAREELSRLVASIKPSGLVSRDELIDMLTEEWSR